MIYDEVEHVSKDRKIVHTLQMRRQYFTSTCMHEPYLPSICTYLFPYEKLINISGNTSVFTEENYGGSGTYHHCHSSKGTSESGANVLPGDMNP